MRKPGTRHALISTAWSERSKRQNCRSVIIDLRGEGGFQTQLWEIMQPSRITSMTLSDR